jgi:hypothetical protein
MTRFRVLGAAAPLALTLSITLAGVAAAPVGARPAAHVAKDDDKDKTDKGDDKGSGNGKGPSDTPATPVPPTAPAAQPAPTPAAAPVPAGKQPGPASKPTTSTPASTIAPGRTAPTLPAAAAIPGISAVPAIALDTQGLLPSLGQSVGVAVATGTVHIRTAPGRDLHALDAAAAIPTGAHVDARAGSVELSAALDGSGTMQTATFSGAIFEVRQPTDGKGLTQLVLTGGDFSACRATRAKRGVVARAAAAKGHGKPVRSLWGKDDHGRFQTRGKGAVGTVRGTRWLTQDFCDGTLTRVVEGSVAVRDLAKHKTVVVHAGHSYFAAL